MSAEVQSRGKSSTGSRSSDRRNQLVFRRSAFSVDDDDEDCGNAEMLSSTTSSAHCNNQPDSQPIDAAQSNSFVADPVITTMDSHDQISSPCVPSTSRDSGVHTESNIVGSPEKVSDGSDLEPRTLEEPSSTSVDRRSRSLTKGEIPKFYSLNTSPPAVKRTTTASRNLRPGGKSRTNASCKTAKSAAASSKQSAASKKSNAAKSDAGTVEDRRLTFVMKKAGDGEDLSAVVAPSEKTQSERKIRELEDCFDVDVEDIMDQDDDILQDVSGCSELFPDDDSNTLIPSSDDLSNLTLVPGHTFSSTSATPSDARHLVTADRRMSEEKLVDDNASSQPVDPATQSSVGNVTSLVVTDMELTNINASQSPVILVSVSDNATWETAFDSAANTNPECQQNMKPTVSHCAAGKVIDESVKDFHRDKSSACTQSKSKRTVTKHTKSSESLVTRAENEDIVETYVTSQPLGKSKHERVVGRQKHSARAHSKNRKTITLPGPTVLPAGDEHVANPEACHGTGLKKSADSKSLSLEMVAGSSDAPRNSETSHASKSSSEQKVDTGDGKPDEQTAEVAPKKVAAYMTKPGKIVYSTAHRRSASSERAVAKSRSKSRSVLPLQSRPRSKQPLVTGRDPVDSPSSAFSFDGTPKEDVVCRPAAMLAARKKYISMDDSMVRSTPAEQRPVVRQRSLSANDSALPSRKVSDDDFASSPHGIMLVLRNGKRTKPRARSKSVRYGASETLSTPPPQQKKLDVPLTPYAKAPEPPSSESTELEFAGVEVVPDSPVFTSTTQESQQPAEDVSQSAVDIASSRSEIEDSTATQDKANAEKVCSSPQFINPLFLFSVLFLKCISTPDIAALSD